jgi:hypothetical protein
LEKAKLPDTKQSMLMVFIRLINTQYDTKLLFDFLAGINVAGTDGLTYPCCEKNEKEKKEKKKKKEKTLTNTYDRQ